MYSNQNGMYNGPQSDQQKHNSQWMLGILLGLFAIGSGLLTILSNRPAQTDGRQEETRPALETLMELGVPEADLAPFPEEMLESLAQALEDRPFTYFCTERLPDGLTDSGGGSGWYLAPGGSGGEDAVSAGDLGLAGLEQAGTVQAETIGGDALSLRLLTFVLWEEESMETAAEIHCLVSYQWLEDAAAFAVNDTWQLYLPDAMHLDSAGFLYLDTSDGSANAQEGLNAPDDIPGSEGALLELVSNGTGSGCIQFILEPDRAVSRDELAGLPLCVQYSRSDSGWENVAAAAVAVENFAAE